MFPANTFDADEYKCHDTLRLLSKAYKRPYANPGNDDLELGKSVRSQCMDWTTRIFISWLLVDLIEYMHNHGTDFEFVELDGAGKRIPEKDSAIAQYLARSKATIYEVPAESSWKRKNTFETFVFLWSTQLADQLEPGGCKMFSFDLLKRMGAFRSLETQPGATQALKIAEPVESLQVAFEDMLFSKFMDSIKSNGGMEKFKNDCGENALNILRKGSAAYTKPTLPTDVSALTMNSAQGSVAAKAGLKHTDTSPAKPPGKGKGKRGPGDFTDTDDSEDEEDEYKPPQPNNKIDIKDKKKGPGAKGNLLDNPEEATAKQRMAQVKTKAQKNLTLAIKSRKIGSDDFGELMKALQERGAIKSITFNNSIVEDLNAISKSHKVDPNAHSVLRNSFHGALISETGAFRKTEKELKTWFKFKADPDNNQGWTDTEKQTYEDEMVVDSQSKKGSKKIRRATSSKKRAKSGKKRPAEALSGSRIPRKNKNKKKKATKTKVDESKKPNESEDDDDDDDDDDEEESEGAQSDGDASDRNDDDDDAAGGSGSNEEASGDSGETANSTEEATDNGGEGDSNGSNSGTSDVSSSAGSTATENEKDQPATTTDSSFHVVSPGNSIYNEFGGKHARFGQEQTSSDSESDSDAKSVDSFETYLKKLPNISAKEGTGRFYI
jgi:hypothetical protein